MISRPEILLLLFILVPITWISIRGYRRSAPGVLAITGGEEREVANVFLVRWFFGTLAFVLALAFATAALAGFRWGRSAPPRRPEEVQTIFAFDVSRSMLAEDIRPSRLERSVAVARNVVGERQGGAFGIVVFKGRGVIYLPVTTDYVSILSFLDSIDVSVMSAPGTDIAAGLEASIAAFPGVRDSRKCVIMFTDGGFLSGAPREAARALAAAGIELALVAAGRETPVPIPFGDGVLVDERGASVESALRLDVIESLGAEAEGSIFRIDDGEIVSLIEGFIGSGGRPRGRLEERYRLFLGTSLAFLFLWVMIRTVRWRRVF